MKISELIRRLEEAKAEHGDMYVGVPDIENTWDPDNREGFAYCDVGGIEIDRGYLPGGDGSELPYCKLVDLEVV